MWIEWRLQWESTILLHSTTGKQPHSSQHSFHHLPKLPADNATILVKSMGTVTRFLPSFLPSLPTPLPPSQCWAFQYNYPQRGQSILNGGSWGVPTKTLLCDIDKVEVWRICLDFFLLANVPTTFLYNKAFRKYLKVINFFISDQDPIPFKRFLYYFNLLSLLQMITIAALSDIMGRRWKHCGQQWW